MRNALLYFVLATSAVLAQPANRVSIGLGTMTVWLGMDKALVKQQIEASGMTSDLSTSTGDRVLVIDAKRVYTLQFARDKLTFAERNWLLDESSALPSVMDALAALIDAGATNCTISHDPITSPDMRLNRIFIDCGLRSVLLTYGSGNIDGKTYTNNSVSERIGKFTGK